MIRKILCLAIGAAALLAAGAASAEPVMAAAHAAGAGSPVLAGAAALAVAGLGASASLQASDAIGAAGAVAPRVSLADMEAKIAEVNYFTAGDAITAINRQAAMMPGGGDIDCGAYSADNPLSLLTLCIVTMENGFTVIGKSAPASPANFDPDKGKQFAYDDAIRQLWPLEGYALRERLAASAEA